MSVVVHKMQNGVYLRHENVPLEPPKIMGAVNSYVILNVRSGVLLYVFHIPRASDVTDLYPKSGRARLIPDELLFVNSSEMYFTKFN